MPTVFNLKFCLSLLLTTINTNKEKGCGGEKRFSKSPARAPRAAAHRTSSNLASIKLVLMRFSDIVRRRRPSPGKALESHTLCIARWLDGDNSDDTYKGGYADYLTGSTLSKLALHVAIHPVRWMCSIVYTTLSEGKGTHTYRCG